MCVTSYTAPMPPIAMRRTIWYRSAKIEPLMSEMVDIRALQAHRGCPRIRGSRRKVDAVSPAGLGSGIISVAGAAGRFDQVIKRSIR
jgi:hypothetical protein